MAILQHHHEGIVRDLPPSPDHAEYPKMLSHPAYVPAVPAVEVREGTAISWTRGEPERFPPVQVKNADDEAYYVARGYKQCGHSDPAAFSRAHAGLRVAPAAYKPQEYPKYIGDVLVNGPDEEAAALAAAEAARVAAEVPALAPEKTADQLRIETLEAQLASLMEMMTAPEAPRRGRPPKQD